MTLIMLIHQKYIINQMQSTYILISPYKSFKSITLQMMDFLSIGMEIEHNLELYIYTQY